MGQILDMGPCHLLSGVLGAPPWAMERRDTPLLSCAPGQVADRLVGVTAQEVGVQEVGAVEVVGLTISQTPARLPPAILESSVQDCTPLCLPDLFSHL